MTPERISLMASFLRDKEPLMYLFLLNANYKKIENSGIMAGVSLRNGITFVYSEDFLKLPVEQFYFILVHEAQHIFKQHLHVFSDYYSEKATREDHMLMNIANDAIINNEIINTDFKYMEELTTKKIFLPDSIAIKVEYRHFLSRNRIDEKDGFTSVRYYNWLRENGYQAQKNGSFYIDLSQEGGGKTTYRIFEDFENGPDGDDQEDEGQRQNDKLASEEVKGMLTRLIKQAEKMESELSSAGKDVGSMTKSFLKAKEATVDWKKELRKRIKYFVSKNVSLPSKKKSYLTYLMNPKSGKDLIFPHYLRQRSNLESNVIVAIDTSGSCFMSTPEMETFFAEINSIADGMKKAKQGKVHLIQWDYDVQGEIIEYNVDDYKKIKLRGGGGTNPDSIFEFLDKNSSIDNFGRISIKNGSLDVISQNPKQLPLVIILTDGDFFRTFKKEGIYENCDNILFFTRHDRYIPKELHTIIYK